MIATTRTPTRPHLPSPAVLDALAEMPTATPTAAELAETLSAAGMPCLRAELAATLRAMEREGLVESWPDPGHPAEVRVMLSTIAIRRLGVTLSPRGDRWQWPR
jgi:hypothetical protein